MFRKKLTINKYLSLITLCVLINLLESWYFGLNMQSQSLAEYICDWINSILIIIFSLWFTFTSNNFTELFKGIISMAIICIVYYAMYVVILV